MSIKNKQNELLIVSSGPTFSLMASLLFLLLGEREFSKINFFLFAINVLPAFPLDGGRILSIFLEERFGTFKGIILFKKISRYTSLFLFVSATFFKNVWLFAVSVLITNRISHLTICPFLRKRTCPTPIKFYYFANDVPMSSVLKMISPYNYMAIIVPGSKKVYFEWEIMESISSGSCPTLFSSTIF